VPSKAGSPCSNLKKQSQFLNALMPFPPYSARDCHGPSGVGMTFYGGFIQSVADERMQELSSQLFVDWMKRMLYYGI